MSYHFSQCSAQNSDFVPSSPTSHCGKSKNTRTSDENADRTDGESSYSSFYSSFFKTDSGSAEDSGDQKNKTSVIKNRVSFSLSLITDYVGNFPVSSTFPLSNPGPNECEVELMTKSVRRLTTIYLTHSGVAMRSKRLIYPAWDRN